ncbi:MAG: OmpA family protein [Saprospiraceae bacterium]
MDIYSFDVPESIKPEKMTYAKGVIEDYDSGELLDAMIKIYDNDNGTELVSQNVVGGTFLYPLKIGRDYNVTIEKPGYLFNSKRINIKDENTITNPFEFKILLQKINRLNSEIKNPVVLDNLFFEYNSSKLDTVKSKVELENLLDLLIDNDQMKIIINGYTDNSGDLNYNLDLSEKRAQAVYNYLIYNKINPQRLQYKGYGESESIDSSQLQKWEGLKTEELSLRL